MRRRLRRPGYRFHPTEGELMFYLKRKVMKKKVPTGDISVLDIYKYAPWHLPDKSGMKNGDLKCYFFCPRAKKYGHGTKIERKTEFGYWKSTGKDKPVVHNGKVVGMRKILTFSASKGDQTSWVMHEYRIEDSGVMDAYVLCEIFEKGGRAPRNISYKEEDYDWGDDGSEAVDISSGLSVPPVGCSSASCILENLASTSKEIPQIASGSIAPVETPHSLVNFDDGITLEDIIKDGDEFQQQFAFPLLFCAVPSSGLTVLPSKEPPISFSPNTSTITSNIFGCSSTSCISENLASTSKGIPQIASTSIVPVDIPLNLDNVDGFSFDKIFHMMDVDVDGFQNTAATAVAANNNNTNGDDIFEGLEDIGSLFDAMNGDGNEEMLFSSRQASYYYSIYEEAMLGSQVEKPFLELNDLNTPLNSDFGSVKDNNNNQDMQFSNFKND